MKENVAPELVSLLKDLRLENGSSQVSEVLTIIALLTQRSEFLRLEICAYNLTSIVV